MLLLCVFLASHVENPLIFQFEEQEYLSSDYSKIIDNLLLHVFMWDLFNCWSISTNLLLQFGDKCSNKSFVNDTVALLCTICVQQDI